MFVVTQTRGREADHAAGAVREAQLPEEDKATASAKKKKVRRLWGDGKGRFRTKGKHGAATVKGTQVADRGPLRPHQGDGQARHGHRPRLRQAQEQDRQKGPLLRGARIRSRDAPDRPHRPRRAPRAARPRGTGPGRGDHQRDRHARRERVGRPQRRPARARPSSASPTTRPGTTGPAAAACARAGAPAPAGRAVPGPRPTRPTGTQGTVQGRSRARRTRAVSIVDILRGETPALRLTQDFHPSPTTPNLYEITTTLRTSAAGR